MRYSPPVARTVLRPACLALARLVRAPAVDCVTRGFLLVSVFLGMEGFLLPDCAVAQTQRGSGSVVRTVETMLSGPDWRLGSFAMDEGEQRGFFLQKFGDRDFRIATVPGEVQGQLGFQGMDLYYQTQDLTSINEKEWWYRKRFTVPKEDSGKLIRLVFEGVDYFATVWVNGKKLGEHEGSFVPFSFDVTSHLNYGAENLLVVKVTCPWFPKGRRFLEYLKGEWMMNDLAGVRFPFPPFLMGPHYANTPAYLAPRPSGLRVALPEEHCATLTAENLITGRTLYVVIRDKTKRGIEVPDQVACTGSLA